MELKKPSSKISQYESCGILRQSETEKNGLSVRDIRDPYNYWKVGSRFLRRSPTNKNLRKYITRIHSKMEFAHAPCLYK